MVANHISFKSEWHERYSKCEELKTGINKFEQG